MHRLYASQRECSATTDHEAATETWQRKNRHLQEHDQTDFRDAWMEVDTDYADRIRMQGSLTNQRTAEWEADRFGVETYNLFDRWHDSGHA